MSDADSVHAMRQRGVAVPEALVAFLVLAFSALAAMQWQSHVRIGSDLSRQHAEALRLAQQHFEVWRARPVAPGAHAAALLGDADEVADAPRLRAAGHPMPAYRLARHLGPLTGSGAQALTVIVRWSDRQGTEQHARLDGVVGGSEPFYAAVLGLAGEARAVNGVFGRSPLVPRAAVSWNDGHSVLRLPGATRAFVLDDASGKVVSNCRVAASVAALTAPAAADLSDCERAIGYLVSGTVRFSPPAGSALGGRWADPLPLQISAVAQNPSAPVQRASAAPAPTPTCSTAAVKAVGFRTDRGEGSAAAAPGAAAGKGDAESGSATGDRYLAYHCVVYPPASGRWSGRLDFSADGSAIGPGEADLRVCHPTPAIAGAGPTSTSAARELVVASSLAHVNFVVLRGSGPCPEFAAAVGPVSELPRAASAAPPELP